MGAEGARWGTIDPLTGDYNLIKGFLDLNVHAMAFAPDGTLYASMGAEGARWGTIDPLTGDYNLIKGSLNLNVHAMAFAPDGTLYASMGAEGARWGTIDPLTGDYNLIKGFLDLNAQSIAFSAPLNVDEPPSVALAVLALIFARSVRRKMNLRHAAEG